MACVLYAAHTELHTVVDEKKRLESEFERYKFHEQVRRHVRLPALLLCVCMCAWHWVIAGALDIPARLLARSLVCKQACKRTHGAQ